MTQATQATQATRRAPGLGVNLLLLTCNVFVVGSSLYELFAMVQNILAS